MSERPYASGLGGLPREVSAAEAAPTATERATIPLAVTRASRAAVVVLVGSLFLERIDKSLYLGGKFPVPDVSFVLAGLVFTAFVLTRVRWRELVAAPVERTEAAVAVFVAVLGFVSLVAALVGPVGLSGTTQSIKTLAHIAFLLFIALLVGRTLSRELISFAFLAYFWITVCACTVAIVQALDVNVLHTGASAALDLQTRAYSSYLTPLSIFSEPAYLGYAALEAILIVLFMPRRSAARVVGALICGTALVLSVSAGALAIAAVTGAYLLVTGKLGLQRRTTVVACGVAIVVVAITTLSPVGHVATHRAKAIWTGNDSSARYRRAVDDAAIKVWKLSPGVGVGLGNSRVYLPRYVHLSFLPNFKAVFADSSAYLGMLAETGPIGMLGLAVLLFVLYGRRSTGDGLDELTRTLIVVTALEFFIINGFVRPQFWLLAGLRLGAIRTQPGDFRAVSVPLPRVRPGGRTSRRTVLVGALALAAVLAAALAIADHHRGPRTVPLSQYGEGVVRDHPLGYWRLGSPDGTPAPHSLPGTLTGRYAFGAPTPIRGGTAHFTVFRHGAFAVTQGLGFRGRSPFSVEIWARGRKLKGYPRIVSTELLTPRGDNGYMLAYNAKRGGLVFARTSGRRTDLVGFSVDLRSRWRYIVATYDGRTMRLFVDGRAVGTTRSQLRIGAPSGTFRIGEGADWYWDGDIAEAAVYGHALTADEIRRHFASARCARVESGAGCRLTR